MTNARFDPPFSKWIMWPWTVAFVAALIANGGFGEIKDPTALAISTAGFGFLSTAGIVAITVPRSRKYLLANREPTAEERDNLGIWCSVAAALTVASVIGLIWAT